MREHPVEDYRLPTEAPPPRFVADCMLGRLARWLRILGYDTLYDRRAEDAEIVRRATDEDRVILTRDTRLVRRRAARRWLLVESMVLEEQLRQVMTAFALALDERRILSRCLLCNRQILPIPRSEASGTVPPFVFQTQERFSRCPSCGRTYWGATHAEDIRRRIEAILIRA